MKVIIKMDELDSLLDAKLDDLSDVPEFKVFPAGVYKVTFSAEAKKLGEHPAVDLTFTVVEVLELAAATETPPAVGDTSSAAYMLDNDIGQGQLKEILKLLQETFLPSETGASIRAILEAAKGAEVQIVTKVRVNKNDASQKYLQVVKLSV